MPSYRGVVALWQGRRELCAECASVEPGTGSGEKELGFPGRLRRDNQGITWVGCIWGLPIGFGEKVFVCCGTERQCYLAVLLCLVPIPFVGHFGYRMSKLSPALKALINAPFARSGQAPAPRHLAAIYQRIAQEARDRKYGNRPWLALSVRCESIIAVGPFFLLTVENHFYTGRSNIHAQFPRVARDPPLRRLQTPNERNPRLRRRGDP